MLRMAAGRLALGRKWPHLRLHGRPGFCQNACRRSPQSGDAVPARSRNCGMGREHKISILPARSSRPVNAGFCFSMT